MIDSGLGSAGSDNFSASYETGGAELRSLHGAENAFLLMKGPNRWGLLQLECVCGLVAKLGIASFC